jgi:hypothetical protein
MVTDRISDDRLHTQARVLVDDFVERHGFRVRPDAKVRDMLADAYVHLAEFGFLDLETPDPAGASQFDEMAQLFRRIAADEMGYVPDTDRSQMVEYTVVGTVIIEVAMSAIRRMALEDASERRFGTGAHR